MFKTSSWVLPFQLKLHHAFLSLLLYWLMEGFICLIFKEWASFLWNKSSFFLINQVPSRRCTQASIPKPFIHRWIDNTFLMLKLVNSSEIYQFFWLIDSRQTVHTWGTWLSEWKVLYQLSPLYSYSLLYHIVMVLLGK